jgi:signal transduction histidine kinase
VSTTPGITQQDKGERPDKSQGEEEASLSKEASVNPPDRAQSPEPLGEPRSEDDAALPARDQIELEDYLRLQEENRRRTAALAAAAHELKTPLAIIAGYIELLLHEKAGTVNELQRQILEDSQFNCTRLRRFIQDFLTYNSLEMGKLVMKFELGDLRACLSELCSFWLPSFRKKGVTLRFPVTSQLLLFPFDYSKVQHLVSNLLENALKYTPAAGVVSVLAEPYVWERRTGQAGTVSYERRGRMSPVQNACRVMVCDTGPGVAPQDQHRIFDEFIRVAQPGEGATGTGLGLAIARRLAEAHGGTIWVERSDPGPGSKFSFLLPFKPVYRKPLTQENRLR